VWPVFLLVAVELLARVPWPHGINWQLLRWAGMVPVAVVAALVSYRHLSGLLAFYGEEPVVCVLGPLAVDGLMVMATAAILATSPTQHTTSTTPAPPPSEALPRTTRTTEASPRTQIQSVPAVPDAPSRDRPAPTTMPIPPASPSDAPAPAPIPSAPPIPHPADVPVPVRPEIPTPAVVAGRITGADTRTEDGSLTALRAAARKPSPRPRTTDPTPAGRLAAPAPDTPVTAPEPATPTEPTVVAPQVLARAREVAQQYRTEHGTAITPGQLAVRLKVTTDQAAQALAVLNLGPDSPTREPATVNGHRPNRTAR
jgi:hypothetical protein